VVDGLDQIFLEVRVVITNVLTLVGWADVQHPAVANDAAILVGFVAIYQIADEYFRLFDVHVMASCDGLRFAHRLPYHLTKNDFAFQLNFGIYVAKSA